MAKRKQEEPPKGAPAWTSTFGDLMNLLLCFFVMLFSMSTMDAQKFELLAASFNQTFSIFSAGASAIGDGLLISNGVSQLNELDNYINSTGRDAEGNVIQTEPAPEEEVIPYDDGLGLPDDMPSDGSESAGESAGEAQSMESVQETETLENGAEETTRAAQ